jgi:RHS repeat-associated protein
VPNPLKVFIYQNDHLGTPQKLTAGNGEVVWSAKYNSFGKATIGIDTIENNLRFAGQYEDAETGLHYNYHRYYDPQSGRYLKHDPIGLYGGLNLFVYTENNPTNFIDHLGLMKWCGSSTQVSAIVLVGATFTRYKLASECVGGKKTVITVWAVGPSVGLGAKGGVTLSNVCFDDYSPIVNPDSFNGVFLSSQGGMTFHPGVPIRPPGYSITPGPGPGVGVSIGTTRLGDSYAAFGASVTYGFDKSISGTIGTSTVVDSKIVDCCGGQ